MSRDLLKDLSSNLFLPALRFSVNNVLRDSLARIGLRRWFPLVMSGSGERELIVGLRALRGVKIVVAAAPEKMSGMSIDRSSSLDSSSIFRF